MLDENGPAGQEQGVRSPRLGSEVELQVQVVATCQKRSQAELRPGSEFRVRSLEVGEGSDAQGSVRGEADGLGNEISKLSTLLLLPEP